MLLRGIRIDCARLVLNDDCWFSSLDVWIVAHVPAIPPHSVQLHANSSLYWSSNQEFNLGAFSSRFCEWREKGEGRKFTGAATKVRRVKYSSGELGMMFTWNALVHIKTSRFKYTADC